MKNTLYRWFDSDVGHSLRASPLAIGAACVAAVCVFCALFAGWVAPHNPFDLATLELSDARLPPAWSPEGYDRYSPMVSRLLHLLVIDVLATCVALRIGAPLQPILQQMKDNLRAKRYT